MPAPNPRGREFGQIHASDPRPRSLPASGYQITAEDCAYLAVSAAHEEPQSPTYPTWAMINRLMAHHSRRASIARLVRNFSQAINPVWVRPWAARGLLHPQTGAVLNPRITAEEIARAGLPASAINRRTHNARWFWYLAEQGRASEHQIAAVSERVRNLRQGRIDQIGAILRGSDEEWRRVRRNVRDGVDSVLRGGVADPIPGLNNYSSTGGARERAARAWELSATEQRAHVDQSRGRLQYGIIFSRRPSSRSARGGEGNVYVRDVQRRRGRPPYPRTTWIIGPEGDSRTSPPSSFAWEGQEIYTYGGRGGGGGVTRGTTTSASPRVGAGETRSAGSGVVEGSRPTGVQPVSTPGALLREHEIVDGMSQWADEMELELARLTRGNR